MEVILIGSLVAGTAMSAISSIQEGQMAEAAAEQNARLLAQQAEAQRLAGEIEAREKRKEGREAVERGRALVAKGGIVPGTGTPGLLAEETAVEYEKDARYIQAGYGMEAQRSLARAGIERAKGKSARRASLWRAGSTIATGAYRTASIYGFPSTKLRNKRTSPTFSGSRAISMFS